MRGRIYLTSSWLCRRRLSKLNSSLNRFETSGTCEPPPSHPKSSRTSKLFPRSTLFHFHGDTRPTSHNKARTSFLRPQQWLTNLKAGAGRGANILANFICVPSSLLLHLSFTIWDVWPRWVSKICSMISDAFSPSFLAKFPLFSLVFSPRVAKCHSCPLSHEMLAYAKSDKI